MWKGQLRGSVLRKKCKVCAAASVSESTEAGSFEEISDLADK